MEEYGKVLHIACACGIIHHSLWFSDFVWRVVLVMLMSSRTLFWRRGWGWVMMSAEVGLEVFVTLKRLLAPSNATTCSSWRAVSLSWDKGSGWSG